MFFARAVGFEDTVRHENALAISVIESESDIEARGWFGKIEMYFDLEPRSDRQALGQRLFVFRKELQPSQQWRNGGAPLAHAFPFNNVSGPPAGPRRTGYAAQVGLDGVLGRAVEDQTATLQHYAALT